MLTRYVANTDTLPYLETIEEQAQEIVRLRKQIENYKIMIKKLQTKTERIGHDLNCNHVDMP